MSVSSLEPSKTPLLSSGVYNTLKNAAAILLPAAGTLYFALAGIWNLPNSEQVVGTIAALNVFVGIVVGLSKKSYDKSDAKFTGVLNVTGMPNQTYPDLSVVLKDHPALLKDASAVLFKVNQK